MLPKVIFTYNLIMFHIEILNLTLLVMKKDVINKIINIITVLNCPKNFKCGKRVFKNLCKGKDVGFDTHLECSEKDALNCAFSISFEKLAIADDHYACILQRN